MIYPEIIEIEDRRKKLNRKKLKMPRISKVALCHDAATSDESYRLWLNGEVSPSLEKVHALRAAIERFEAMDFEQRTARLKQIAADLADIRAKKLKKKTPK